MTGRDKSTHGMMWTTIQVREARNRTSSYAGMSRHGVHLLSKGRTLNQFFHIQILSAGGNLDVKILKYG